MNQTAITMTTDNSRNRKQANHRGPICILVCVCTRWCAGGRAQKLENRRGWQGRTGRVSDGVRVKGLSSLPGCMLLSLALSSPIKPATPQQYGAINYRHAAINAERRGEERQEHINRTNGHIKDIKPCSLPLSNTHKHSLCTFYLFEVSFCFWMSLGLFQIQMGKKKNCTMHAFLTLSWYWGKFMKKAKNYVKI